jgi:hypothetical protein
MLCIVPLGRTIVAGGFNRRITASIPKGCQPLAGGQAQRHPRIACGRIHRTLQGCQNRYAPDDFRIPLFHTRRLFRGGGHTGGRLDPPRPSTRIAKAPGLAVEYFILDCANRFLAA